VEAVKRIYPGDVLACVDVWDASGAIIPIFVVAVPYRQYMLPNPSTFVIAIVGHDARIREFHVWNGNYKVVATCARRWWPW
jgi:hypothetical protein